MKRTLLATLLFALALVVTPLHAQDETLGAQTQITVAVPVGGLNCGRALANAISCSFPIPVNIGGTFSLMAFPAAPTPYGSIYFFGVGDLGNAFTLSKQTFTADSLHRLLTLHVEFTGLTNDGDGSAYAGTGDFTFTYVYHTGGGGRGNSSYYVQLMQTGSLTMTYN
jgi:hypothetical protein